MISKPIRKYLEPLIIIILFFSLFVIIPVYDTENGFYNIIFSNYTLKWHDGRSPLNFYIIKNILSGNALAFPKGYKIGDMLVENYFDFREKDGMFYPIFSILANYIFAFILYFLPVASDLELFKAIIIINILILSIILTFFYYLQKNLKLKTKYAFLSTLIAGVATTPVIYSRYLFIGDTIFALLLIILTYQLVKIFNKKEFANKNEIIIIISLIILLSLILFQMYLLTIGIFIYFSYVLLKYKKIKSAKAYIISILVIICVSILLIFILKPFGNVFPISFYVFPKFIPALDYEIYGYHDPTTVWKLDRELYDIYAFGEQPGNAIFLRFYGLFGSLFGAKGIIYNSLFLTFSIIGIFLLYKDFKIKFLILIPTILIILAIGLIDTVWFGGVTPRYDRLLTVPALFLTFFSFYYIQEVSKEKNKMKKYLIHTIFIILVVLSTLNVISLAVRTDWTYEHEANLISYDLVLWPWYPPTTQENTINLYLTELGESVEWKFNGETNCKAYGTSEGIITNLCSCEFSTYAERSINIPWEKVRVNITACGKSSDGVIAEFYFDDVNNSLFIEPDSCKEKSLIIENSSGEHNLILKPKKYNECTTEVVIWKLITIEEIK